MKKKLNEYGWITHYSMMKKGFTVDGIEYRVPRKRTHNCDGCGFIRRKDGVQDEATAYYCIAGAEVQPKASGIGCRPVGLCLPCKVASMQKLENRSKLLLMKIKAACDEEDEAEELYMAMEQDPYFGG